MPMATLYILDNAFGAIGRTPLIRLTRVAENLKPGLKCNLLAKVEYTSVGGSMKDRIAQGMLEAAEKAGTLIPGKSTVIEPTSGNTGIGLAMACAIKGYPLVITLPNRMSVEKEATMRALGAHVVRTPTEAEWDSPESHIGVAKRLKESIEGAVILDQYGNPNNPLAHECTTGPEIIEAVVSTPPTIKYPSSEKVDVLVAGAGTGGLVVGTSKAIKKAHNPDCIVVAVDPIGSTLATDISPSSLNLAAPFEVEGIGHNFVPEVLSYSDVDVWVKVGDDESFDAVRLLMRTEGLLVGGSSGSTLVGALRWLKETEHGRRVAETEGANVVVILPDGIRNYMSKPWFLKRAMEAEPSSLGQRIVDVLRRPSSAQERV